jgi:hypothetical protein
MATLAKGTAALWIGVTFVVIHMSDRQYDFAACLWVMFSINCSAFRVLRCSLTSVPSALQ